MDGIQQRAASPACLNDVDRPTIEELSRWAWEGCPGAGHDGRTWGLDTLSLGAEVLASELQVTHSKWAPVQGAVERGRAKRFAKLSNKIGSSGGLSEWRAVTLTFARNNVQHVTGKDGRIIGATRPGLSWVKVDGGLRDAGEWFHLIRKHRLVGEFKRRLEHRLGRKLEYFKASEFQEDGFIHFHVLIRVSDIKGKMIGYRMLEESWGWGFVYEGAIERKDVAYASKGVAYAFKGIEGRTPEYMRSLTSMTKVTSTSRGFFPPAPEPKSTRPGKPRAKPPSIGALLDAPAIGVRTRVKCWITDPETREIRTVTREVKGGDVRKLMTLALQTGKLSASKGVSSVCVGALQVRSQEKVDEASMESLGGHAEHSRSGAAGKASANADGCPPPLLDQSLHCGVGHWLRALSWVCAGTM